MANTTPKKQAYIKVTQIRSTIGRIERQKRTAKALGLGRVNSSRVLPDNPAVRGMVDSIGHLVRVEPAEVSGERNKKNTKITRSTKSTKITKAKTASSSAKRQVGDDAIESETEKVAQSPSRSAVAKKPAPKPASAKAPSAAKAPEGKPAGKKETKS